MIRQKTTHDSCPALLLDKARLGGVDDRLLMKRRSMLWGEAIKTRRKK